NKQPFTTHVRAPAEGTTLEVRIPRLADAPKPIEPDLATSRREPVLVETRPLRTTGLVVAGVGVATLGTGLIFGLVAINANNAGKHRCIGQGPEFDPATGHCLDNSPALRSANGLKDDARAYGTVANVLVPLGVVAIGVGTYLAIFYRERSKTTA